MKTNKIFFYGVAIISLFLWAAIVDAHEETKYPPIVVGEVIKSASEVDYPPFSIVNERGQADGFSVELLREALKAVGFGVEYKVGPWPEVKGDLEAGNYKGSAACRKDSRERISLRLHCPLFFY